MLTSRLMELLAWQTQRYTMGESTSVTVETAQELLNSLWYTLTVAADEMHTSYKRLLTDDLRPLAAQGQKILRDRLEQTKRLWTAVCKSAPPVENAYYSDTLRGIGNYIKRYDLYYFAHQKPPCIDYPLLIPADEALQGLDFTGRYLKNMLTENLILHRFDKDAAISVLCAAAPDYQEHYLNLCEQPLTNAFGLALIGKDGRKPYICREEQQMITETLRGRDGEKRRRLLCASANTLCDTMQIANAHLREYAAAFAESLLPRIEAAMTGGELSNIFIAAGQ